MFKKTRYKTKSRIIEENLDYLVRFAYYRLGNKGDAEDLVYDAILLGGKNKRWCRLEILTLRTRLMK